ncbi:MAG: lipoprotein-releasing ABC transporter permease subunit [Myxococcota bacterium]
MWQILSAAAGGLALTLIVGIAVGVFLLTLVYLASAVVVLERFALATLQRRWIALFGVVTAVLATAFLLHGRWLEVSFGAGPRAVWVAGTIAAATTALSIVACRLALLRTRSPLRGTVVLVLLALAGALWLGSTARLWLPASPAVVIAGLAFGVRALRRRSAADGKGDTALERQLVGVAAALALGALLAMVLPAPDRRLADFGEAIFALIFGVILLGLVPLAAAGLVEVRRSAEWFIAIRYLIAKRRQVFISAITAICIGGIAAGVWLIIIVLSVMNGFERTWREEILGNRAHFTIHHDSGEITDFEKVLADVRQAPGVEGASPYLDADGMVRGRGGEIFSVRVRGIDPVSIGDVTDLPSDVILGSFEELDAPGAVPGIVIGNQLALSIGATLGDELMLISPFGGPRTPLGPAPRLERFQVAGVYQSSFFQYDEVYAYVSVPAAQSFRRAGPVIDGVEVRTSDFYRSAAVGEGAAARLGHDYYARDWKEFFPAFFQALKTERAMMFVLLTMIMVVAAFLIVATLVMMIMEKSSDIAILKAMGAEDQTVERIFAIEGTLIGLAGTVVGVLAGIAVTHQLGWIQDRIEMLTGVDALPASIYQFSTLPSEVDPTQVALVAVIAMVLSLGATLLPSRQGARLDPAEGLRYE